MKVLVTFATKHGSTAEIAQAIGYELADAGLEVDVAPVADVHDVAGYGAVVVGSAIYVGRWLPEAVRFVAANAATLAERPVWLFSSGPIGAPEPKPARDPEGLAEVTAKVEPRGQRTFAGKIDRSQLSLGERVITRVVGAPAGDFRDWPAVADYAREIAAALSADAISAPGAGDRRGPAGRS